MDREMRTTAIILAASDIELLKRVAHVRALLGKSERTSVSDVIRSLIDEARQKLEGEAAELRAVKPICRPKPSRK